jgi:ABC-type transport system involved in resistance to organic solvents, ATPase component
MRLTKRLQFGVSALACSAALATAGAAATPQALSPIDAQRYAAAFEATDRGDFIEAQMQTVQVQDKSLLGYLSFRALMHPTAPAAAFDELIKDLSDSLDLTVFMITHDLDTLYEITDRVAVLADKQVVAVAPVRELEKSDHPWIKEYFLGPRGRAAAKARIEA